MPILFSFSRFYRFSNFGFMGRSMRGSFFKESKVKFAITGATGFLGRNLVLEIIKQNYLDLSNVDIFIIGRSSGIDSLEARMKQILEEEMIDYIGDQILDRDTLLNDVMASMKFISIISDGFEISHDDYKMLSCGTIDFFYHIAASTDLRHGAKVTTELEKINVDGTRAVLDLVDKLNVKEFCYVGTAYECGKTYGKIAPDYVNLNQSFRSPYKLSKLKAEILVRSFEKKGMRFRYFRPSVTCGRLIENIIGATPKFDVFYSWAVFFIKYKQSKMIGDFINTPINLDMRFYYSPSGGLNIVPVDLAAKIMYHSCILNDNNDSYHLANKTETPHSMYTSIMLESINVMGIKGVEYMPDNLNHLELLYYKSVGKILTPYVDQDPILFDVRSSESVCRKANIFWPEINEDSFRNLMKYAKNKAFGIQDTSNDALSSSFVVGLPSSNRDIYKENNHSQLHYSG